jgi:hypothetical protein
LLHTISSTVTRLLRYLPGITLILLPLPLLLLLPLLLPLFLLLLLLLCRHVSR